MIAVVGPGALGKLFAARLALAGREVVLLDHRPARAARLSASGIVLEENVGAGFAPARGSQEAGVAAEQRVPVRVSADPASLAPAGVLLCVKVGATESALSAIQRLQGAPWVAVLQNGMARPERVAELLGDPARVIGAVTSEGATALGEDGVRHAGRGHTQLGPLPGQPGEPAREALEALRAAGFDAALTSDVVRAGWEKLQVNAAINALTGILGCPNGALLAGPAEALAQQAAEEAGQVAAAKGVAGDWGPAASRKRWHAVSRATTLNISSTLQDLRSGRRTEVHAINGAVAAAAKELGLEAPTNALLTQLIAALEEIGSPQAPPVQ